MKSLSGLSLCLLFALVLSGCRSYTTPASSIAYLTPVPTAAPRPTGDLPSLWGRYTYHTSHWLDLLGNGMAYYAAQPFMVMRDAYRITGNEIVFTGSECNHAAGTYDWTMDQGLLDLTRVSDPCSSRAGMLDNILRRLSQQFPFATVQWIRPLEVPGFDQAAVDKIGNLYVTDGKGSFYRYDANGGGSVAWSNALTNTTGIAVDSLGDIYVANFDDATVHEFDSGGQPLRSWPVGGGTDGPSALAIDAQGNVYVAMRRFHGYYLEKYSADGKLIRRWASGGNGDGEVGAGFRTGPESIAVDPAGDLYVADTVNDRLIKFDPNGAFLFNITGNGDRALFEPTTVAVDSKGNVYTVSDEAIWKFDSSGAFAGEWFTPYEGNLVIDGNDDIFLVGQAIVKVQLGK